MLMNDQLGLNPFDAPAIIQEKKKYASFTVREIGGPLEIIAWRKAQEQKEIQNQVIRLQLLQKQKDTMFGSDAPQGDSVTWQGHVDSRPFLSSWEAKLERVKSERKRLAQKEFYEPIEYVPLTVIAPTLWERMKQFVKEIWNEATEK
jgi:hypothetical protein